VPVKKLHDAYGEQVQFLDVIIRQAHPGEKRGRYLDFEDKLRSAQEYKQLERIAWAVLVDDYEGTVHRAYSQEMADPSFLIDAQGRVAFYCMWTHAPSLKPAFDELLARGGVGAPVAGGIDKVPHLLASFVDGVRGPQRGGKRAVREYTTGGFGVGLLSLALNKAKPVLGPLALRAEPLPVQAKLGLAVLAVFVVAAVVLLIAAA
jgi:hypothetical protein